MNLLLVSIDSLRLDFVSRTGQRVHTPRFDAVTRGFGFCGTCFSVSSVTRPVHTTLFTGLYPFEHGVSGQRVPGMRVEAPTLFDLFVEQGYRASGFSEAANVFFGLPFARHLAPLPPQARDGVQVIARWLRRESAAAAFLFVHYWSAHAPYGAADGLALGETARMLASGRLAEVQQRYARTVEEVFETKVAPLLQQLDLSRWSVLVLSDHGEGWTAEEPYHGQTLRNSVLRVPLYFHIPGSGNLPLPSPLVSLVDIFPTCTALFGLPRAAPGLGCDVRRHERPAHYLAEIDPVAPREDRPPTPASPLLAGPRLTGPQWALFDAARKFTYFVERREGRLERTMTEEPLHEADAMERSLRARAHLLRQSAYAAEKPDPVPAGDRDMLDRRLRDLGYLD